MLNFKKSIKLTVLSAMAALFINAAPATAADSTESVNFSSEISNATFNVKQLPFPITNVSGKVKWLDNGTEINGVSFKVLDSTFTASGLVGKGDKPHKFTVSSDALKFDDLKKIFPIVSQFNMAGTMKFSCDVAGTKDAPELKGVVSLPSSNFDFGSLMPELKGIDIKNVSAGFAYSKDNYEISDFKFNAMDGSVVLGGKYSQAKPDDATLSFKVEGIDAAKLSKFSEKLSGKLSGEVNADFKIRNVMNKEKLFAEGTLFLKNGVLKNMPFLEKLGGQLKTSGLGELNYSKIGGHFKLYPSQKIDFKNFEVVSEIIKLKSTGTIDENKMVSAKLFAELTGDKFGDKIGDKRLGKLLQKLSKGIKCNFNVTGSANSPKLDLDMGGSGE